MDRLYSMRVWIAMADFGSIETGSYFFYAGVTKEASTPVLYRWKASMEGNLHFPYRGVVCMRERGLDRYAV
jgi:hypothetical protein